LAQRRSGVQTLPKTHFGGVLFLESAKKKREDSLESSLCCCAVKELKLTSVKLAYCPEVAVLAEAAPADFGTLR
jgi:hypothetical protein